VIATIPVPIVGGVYLALFGLIAAVGLSNLRGPTWTRSAT
jgi:solute carrier family 23 (nucleobase transporter), member 1